MILVIRCFQQSFRCLRSMKNIARRFAVSNIKCIHLLVLKYETKILNRKELIMYISKNTFGKEILAIEKQQYCLFEMTSNCIKSSILLDGFLGKTAQFWMLYIDIVNLQNQAHTAIQENNFDLRLESINKFIPLYFYFNMPNYARYMSYYSEVLSNIDTLYPGLKPILQSTGLSIQAQDRYPLRTSIDQRGEQTINRDAKTSGGVGSFAASSSAVLKWCLSRQVIFYILWL